MKAFNLHLRPKMGGWVFIAQALVGSFFVCSGFYKTYTYFIYKRYTLSQHFDIWIERGWPPDWYDHVLLWLEQFDFPLTLLLIVMHTTGGLLLMVNKRTRLAGWILMLVQINIFFGTFHRLSFVELVGLSLWLTLYFILRPLDPRTMPKRTWKLLTYILIGFFVLLFYNRYQYGDPWPFALEYKRENLFGDIYSVSLWWKYIALWLMDLPFAHYVWASFWWLQILLTIGFLTPWRLYSGAILLTFNILSVLTWMNSTTSQGMIWILALLVWTAQEHLLQSSQKL